MEPEPANVDGKKIEKVTHSVEHSIDWGHVAIGVGALAVAWALLRLFSTSEDKNEDDGLMTEV
jgi:hypothetical protein